MPSLRNILALLVLATAGAAGAQTPVADQSLDLPWGTAEYGALGANINEGVPQVFQTFTAGKTGTLVGVNAQVYGRSDATSQLRLSIQGVRADGLPDGIELASTTLATTGTTMADLVAFTPGVSVTAGTRYTLVADYVNAPPFGAGQFQGLWGGLTGNPYAGGEFVAHYDSGWVYQGSGYDLFFRTWVLEDVDGDGVTPPLDCNDADASVLPGALEVPRDGVDQDCNGYDLTIDVLRAVYQKSALKIEATSALGAGAALQVKGIGPMKFDALTGLWALNLKVANPGVVSVCGVEGCTAAAVVAK